MRVADKLVCRLLQRRVQLELSCVILVPELLLVPKLEEAGRPQGSDRARNPIDQRVLDAAGLPAGEGADRADGRIEGTSGEVVE